MDKVINFTKNRFIFLALSVLLIVGFWVGTYLQDWFNLGIDFQAGLTVQVQIQGDGIDQAMVSQAIMGFENEPQVQQLGESSDQVFKITVGEEKDMEDFNEVAETMILEDLKARFGATNVTRESSQFVGARYAGRLASSTLWLTLVALSIILIYIWVRFKLDYAVSAIIAIFHDVLFLTGIIGLFQLEVSTATVAAVLTIIGYSLNDTIVIFDRIRENAKQVKDKTFEEVVNISVTQSLSRTLITSLTTLIAVGAIYIFSTGAIKVFALNLIIGVLVGTYSSIFIASTVLIGWHNRHAKKTSKKLAGSRGDDKVISISSGSKSAPTPVQQTAEEIAVATEQKRKKKAKKKKK